jgi:hypothetical protein
MDDSSLYFSLLPQPETCSQLTASTATLSACYRRSFCLSGTGRIRGRIPLSFPKIITGRKAASKVAPYISRPLTVPPQSQASEARHGSGMRPKVGFPYSSAGSDLAGRDQSLAALPYDAISNAKAFEASAMPTQDGLRLNHLHRTKKVWPNPGHPYEQRAITATPSKTRWCLPHSDG